MAEILSIVSIVAFVIAGISMGLAVFFWFFFRIPSVIGDLSGRTARKSIARMRENNEKTGKKTYHTGAINRERGKLTDTMPQTAKVKGAPKAFTEDMSATGLLVEENIGYVGKSQEFTTLLAGEAETELLVETPPEAPKRMGGKELTLLEDIVLVHTAEVI